MGATPPLPHARRSFAEWLALLVALLILAGILGFSQFRHYVALEAEQRDRLASHAELVEKNLVPQLFATKRALDGILEDLPIWVTKKDGMTQANRRLVVLSDTLTGVSALLITNAEGKTIASNLENLVGLDISTRDYFQNAIRKRDREALYVAPPFINAPGNVALAVSREITGPRGEFGGLVIAGLDPACCRNLLASVRYTPDVATYLVHGDGKLFMMVPETKELIGRDLTAPNSVFSRHRSSGRTASVLAGASFVTGERQMAALRTIHLADLGADKPLVVTVSRDFQALFAPWRRESIVEWGMFCVLALCAILSLFFYQRRRRIFERLTERQELALRASEAQLRATIDSAIDGAISIDSSGKLIDFNPAAEKMFGWKKEEILGRSMAEILVPERQREAHQMGLARYVQTRQSHILNQHIEFSALRRDGSEFPSELAITAIRQNDQDIFTAYIRDITERKQLEDQVRQLAFHDALTNLPNRRLLNERLSQAMAASRRSGCYCALMLVDLDNFKPVNDAHGHGVGDILLVEVAVRLKSCVREVDTVARLGGDEFVVMLSGLSADRAESAVQAGIIAEELRTALARSYVLQVRHEGAAETIVEHRCTASIGVALFRKHDADKEDILKWADMAMYQAKEAGGDVILFFDQRA